MYFAGLKIAYASELLKADIIEQNEASDGKADD